MARTCITFTYQGRNAILQPAAAIIVQPVISVIGMACQTTRKKRFKVSICTCSRGAGSSTDSAGRSTTSA